LDEPLTFDQPSRVRVILLISEDESEEDNVEAIREGIYQGWQEARTGKFYPIAELWEGIDVD
jgi:hypothetical protein